MEPEQLVSGQENVTSNEDSRLVDLSALIKGKKITSPSELDAWVEDDNLKETSYISEKEDVSLVLPEPIAIGMSESEFERFKQQLLEIPPEFKSGGSSGAICEKCSSIIYRPVL